MIGNHRSAARDEPEQYRLEPIEAPPFVRIAGEGDGFAGRGRGVDAALHGDRVYACWLSGVSRVSLNSASHSGRRDRSPARPSVGQVERCENRTGGNLADCRP